MRRKPEKNVCSGSGCIAVWGCWEDCWRRYCFVERESGNGDRSHNYVDLLRADGIRAFSFNRCVPVLNLVLKRAEREEQAMMTTLAGLVVVLMLLVDQIGTLFERVKSVFGL